MDITLLSLVVSECKGNNWNQKYYIRLETNLIRVKSNIFITNTYNKKKIYVTHGIIYEKKIYWTNHTKDGIAKPNPAPSLDLIIPSRLDS